MNVHMAAFREIRFESSNCDEVRESLTKIFTSHELRLINCSQRLHTIVNETSFGKSSIVYVKYGAPVIIEADELKQYYLFQMAWGGKLDVSTHRSSRACACDSANLSIISPEDVFRLKWSPDASTLSIKLHKSAVERNLEQALGMPAYKPLCFYPSKRLATPEGKSWRNIVDFVQKQLALPGPFIPAIGESLEDTLARFALNLLPHNYSHELEERPIDSLPKVIRQAKSYVDENLQKDIGIAEILAVSGASQTTLCKYFKQYLNVSPREYLRNARLQAARRELLTASTQTSVADVAMKYSFNHLGRFSDYYRRKFGEMPSATLRHPK